MTGLLYHVTTCCTMIQEELFLIRLEFLWKIERPAQGGQNPCSRCQRNPWLHHSPYWPSRHWIQCSRYIFIYSDVLHAKRLAVVISPDFSVRCKAPVTNLDEKVCRRIRPQGQISWRKAEINCSNSSRHKDNDIRIDIRWDVVIVVIVSKHKYTNTYMKYIWEIHMKYMPEGTTSCFTATRWTSYIDLKGKVW